MVTAAHAPAAPPPQPDSTDAEHLQLTTLRGWRRFVHTTPHVPDLLDHGRLTTLTAGQRLAYDEARLTHHAQLVVIATATIRRVTLEGRRLTYLNRRAETGRCGLIVSGPARTGKTTAIIQMAKTLEVIHRQRHPHNGGDIPVVYITAPPAATGRMIAVEFARFLGIPLLRKPNITEVMEAVCGVCLDARTSLIVVDFTDRE